ncbi:hypothetical protein PENSPDRAFT_287216 [Peniophora sp. CONT]|nr:hypothetical protein PENSPDRAFT_287216 [Peniophora sp. CONT]
MPTIMPSISGWEAVSDVNVESRSVIDQDPQPFAQNTWQPYGGPPSIQMSVPEAQHQTSAPLAPSEDGLTWDVLSSFGELGLTATPPSSPHPYLAGTPPPPPPPSASSATSYSAAPSRQTSFKSLASDSLPAYNYNSSWSSMPVDDRAVDSFSPQIALAALPPSPSLAITASNASLATYDPSKLAPLTSESSQAMLSTDAFAATGAGPSRAPTWHTPATRAPAPRASTTRSPNFGHRTPRFRTREQWASVHLDEYGVFIPPKKCSDGKWMCVCGTKMKSVASIRERHGSYKERYGCRKPECGVSFARRDARVRHECLMHNMHAECKVGISRCSKALSQPPRRRPAYGLAARAQ